LLQAIAAISFFHSWHVRPMVEGAPPRGSINRLASYKIFRSEKNVARNGRRQSLMPNHVSVVTEHHHGRFFAEARPVLGNTYFPASTASVCVVVALYNENGPELSRTLESLTNSGVALDIVVVADGLAKLSGSMRKYLTQMFKFERADALLNPDSHVWGAKNQTFISEQISMGSSDCKVQVLLKRFNHKKINTHEWFFRAHCPNSGCQYALTTDTGAVFRPGSVLKMVRFFVRNKNVAAVTGRQRVMSEFNQRVRNRAAHGEPVEKDTLFEACMRLLQGFDFEIDHTGGKAASLVAGLLPCLHGPCAFFRFDVIQGRCLNEYFDEWGYAPPHTLKLIGANLQLAEDRIPSLLGVLYSGGMRSDSTMDAVFEFEAELSLKAFMTQRRRWINGTIAGCIYTLSHAGIILMSKEHSLYFKVTNVLLLVLQTLGFFLMFLTPGLFGFLFGSAAGLVASHAYGSDAPVLVFPTAPPPLPKLVSVELLARVATMAVYGVLYAIFVWVHLKRIGKNDCVLQPTLTKVVIGLNAALALLVVAAIIINFSVAGAWFLLAVYMSVPGLPIACACIGGDFEGAFLMLKSFPVFALVSPSFVGSLSAYSAARIADLSWGNRP
jgi:cellulose synthase/poly-beta-1,6-N-acetylglucosamine synthase-like glycosyltransferase